MHGSALAHLGRLTEGCEELERANSTPDDRQKGLLPSTWPFRRASEAQVASCLSELYRLRGELLLPGGTTTSRREAERHFGRAIDVARSQGARLFELLATMRLCRLRHEAERHRTQSHALAAVYDSFTEGLRTPALLEARTLLDALG